jgi:TetR/AcrR family transcriptional regulator, cholesterol catabolism regulator
MSALTILGVTTRSPTRKGPKAAIRPARPARTRGEQRADTRARIRAAAWELFTTRGFDETTTQAIAVRAGVAAGTVFVHASDKADLLFLVMHDRLAEVVEDRVATLPDAPLLERLMHIFGGLFRMYGEHPGVAAAFIRNLPGAKGPNAQRTATLSLGFLHRLSLLVADAQRSGEVSAEVDGIACARNLFALYFMALLAWLDGFASLDAALDPLLRDSLALQIRGFRP